MRPSVGAQSLGMSKSSGNLNNFSAPQQQSAQTSSTPRPQNKPKNFLKLNRLSVGAIGAIRHATPGNRGLTARSTYQHT